jgi:hypothetical protein
LGGDNTRIGLYEKKFHMNMCLILNVYRARGVPATNIKTL